MISEIILIILPVFLVIGLGFGLKRTGFFSSGFLVDLNRLIYFIALPALLFYKIAKADFSSSFNGSLLVGIIISLCVISVLSYGFGSFRGYNPEKLGAFCQGAFRGNLAYIGLAVTYNAYGDKGLAIAGVLTGFLVPIMNFFAVCALLFPQRKMNNEMGRSDVAIKIMNNPLIIASFVGILWSYFQLPLPLVVDKAFGIVTGMSLPMALIAIGASFSFRKLQGDFVAASIATFMKIVLLPLLVAVILQLLGVGGVDLGVGRIIAGSPTATAAYIMALQMKSDAELSGTIIMLSTMFSIITYALALYCMVK